VVDALKIKAGVNAFSEPDFIVALLADFGMKNVSSDGYNNMLAIVNVAFEGVSRCPNGLQVPDAAAVTYNENASYGEMQERFKRDELDPLALPVSVPPVTVLPVQPMAV